MQQPNNFNFVSLDNHRSAKRTLHPALVAKVVQMFRD
jgi:hypothetical protein